MAYFRVTAYHPAEDVSAIIDSNGYFEKLWQLSSCLVQKGFKIAEASSSFPDGTLPKADAAPQHLILRACHTGKPEYQNGAVQVGGKCYLPKK